MKIKSEYKDLEEKYYLESRIRELTSQEMSSMRHNMQELETKYHSLKTTVKSKYEHQLRNITNEWRGEKEALLDLVQHECNSIVKKVEKRMSPISNKGTSLSVDVTDSPSRVVNDLFSDPDEELAPNTTIKNEEESFEDIEELVVGILNSCGNHDGDETTMIDYAGKISLENPGFT